eukprot:11529044-Ditylum_brightwellii.AAC.1
MKEVEARTEREREEEEEKVKKNAKDTEKSAEKRAEVPTECSKLITNINEKGSRHIMTFNNDQPKSSLQYDDDDELFKRKDTKKADCQATVIAHYNGQQEEKHFILPIQGRPNCHHRMKLGVNDMVV